MEILYFSLAVLASYLLGSLSFAVLVSRVLGLSDPRSYGSKNPGATNVLRSGSKLAAVLTLVLDALKATVPVLLVKHFGQDFGLGDGAVAAAALAAFIGHVWPVFFGFAGGKGVATALGALLGLNWMLALATLLSWVIVAYFSRYSSLAALVAAVFAPVYYLMLSKVLWPLHGGIAIAIVAMSVVLVYRHRANISRLIAGTEPKLGKK